MNEEEKDILLDLLTKKAVYGLDAEEERALAGYDPAEATREFRSLEMAAAAISLIDLPADEQMPAHLRERILDEGEQYVSASAEPPSTAVVSTEKVTSGGSWFGWLGWAAAAAAVVALVFNIWSTRTDRGPEVGKIAQPVETPRVMTPAEQREEFMRSGTPLIKASWAPGNVKELKDISGDVVWSEEKQTGYMTFRGLPVNDAATTCYQLWIFDKTQDKATPIDGGIFDVDKNGEVVIPINAKLKAVGPQMFAITIERHGGVVVSKREKIAALAKVETQAS